MTRPATPSQQEGPDNSPPKIPDGYVAQWDGTSKSTTRSYLLRMKNLTDGHTLRVLLCRDGDRYVQRFIGDLYTTAWIRLTIRVTAGVSSWTVPEKASSSVPVVGPTPQPEGHPYSIPPAEGQRGLNDNPENFEGTDRSLISVSRGDQGCGPLCPNDCKGPSDQRYTGETWQAPRP